MLSDDDDTYVFSETVNDVKQIENFSKNKSSVAFVNSKNNYFINPASFITSDSQETRKLSVHQIGTSSLETWSYTSSKAIINTTNITQLFCNKCGALFHDFQNLRAHLFNPPEDKHFFRCANCKYKTSTLIEHLQHIEKFCGQSKVRMCEQFNSLTNCSNQRYFCEICCKEYLILFDLLNHQRRHYNIRLSCSMCCYRAHSFKDLTDHSIIHTVQRHVDLTCHICSLNFHAPIPYKLHYFLIHPQILNVKFKCSYCLEILADEELFAIHLKSHSELSNEISSFTDQLTEDGNNLVCEVCAKVFPDKNACTAHRIEAHNLSDDSEWQCSLCSTKTCIAEIILHLKGHSNKDLTTLSTFKEPPSSVRNKFKCGECKKVFYSKRVLRKHRKNHFAEAPASLSTPMVAKSPTEILPVTVSTLTPKIEPPKQPRSNEILRDKHITNSSTNLISKSESQGVPTIDLTSFSKSKRFQRKCLDCNKVCYSKRSLNSHKKSHLVNNNNSDSTVPSITMSKEIPTIDLTSALETSPLRLKPSSNSIRCPDCHQTFASLKVFKEHTVKHYKAWEKSGVHMLKSLEQSVDDVIILSDDDDQGNDENIYEERTGYRSSEEDSDDDIIAVDDESEINAISKSEEKEDISDEKNYKGKKLIKQLYCNKCGELFSDFLILHRHIFAKNHVFNCEKCSKKIGHTVTQLKEHLKNNCSISVEKNVDEHAETNVLKYYCERCGQGFSLLAKLTEHYKIHKNELICCSLCPIRVVSFDQIMSHFKSHTLINNIELVCKLCNLHFFALHPYRLHCNFVHSLFVNIPYNCILCTQIFKDHKEFLWHVQSHTKLVLKTNMNPHRPDKNVSYITCEICAQIFEDSESCKQHKDICHDINILRQAEKPCPVCSKKFKVVEMSNHISQHEEMEVTELPQSVQQQENHLEETVSSQNTTQIKKKGQSKVKCYTCKEMVLLATLEEHRESHRFKCTMCPRSFNTNQGLSQHTIGHNSVESNQTFEESSDQSYLPLNQPTCNDCGRTFISMYALREHAKVHNVHTGANRSTWSSHSFQQNFTMHTSQNTYSWRKFSNYNSGDLELDGQNFYKSSAQMQSTSFGGPSFPLSASNSKTYDRSSQETTRRFTFEPPSTPQTDSLDYSLDQNSYNDQVMVRNPFSGDSLASLMPGDQAGDYRDHPRDRGRFGNRNFQR